MRQSPILSTEGGAILVEVVPTVLSLLALSAGGVLFAFFPTQLVRWNGLAQRWLAERMFGRSVDSLPPAMRDFVQRAIDVPQTFAGRIFFYRVGGILLCLVTLAAWCAFGSALRGG